MNANQIASKNAKKDFKKSQSPDSAKKNSASSDAKKDEKSSSLTKINLDQFAKQLESVNVKEKKEKSHIYNYPEGKEKGWINSEDGKKWRNKQRSTLNRHSGNILLFAKMKRMDDLKKEIDLFQKFYKEIFRINDYSLSSISSSNDESKTIQYSLALEIVKSSL